MPNTPLVLKCISINGGSNSTTILPDIQRTGKLSRIISLPNLTKNAKLPPIKPVYFSFVNTNTHKKRTS